MTTPHPPAEALAAFGLGRLARAESDSVEAHLSTCPDCQRAVESAADDDPLVRLVRSAGPDDRPAARPATHAEYEHLRFHARGGLGEVSLAWDAVLGREVAVKRLLPAADDPRGRARFAREAAVTGRLEHPGVVPVYGAGADESGRPCYAMRFVRGQTLREAIKAHHAAPTPAGLRHLLGRFVAVCQTAAYAHSRGVVHRDIKPANVVLGSFGETVLLDWGLAAEERGEGRGSVPPPPRRPLYGPPHPPAPHPSLTATGAVLGTPGYMAPEQARGEAVGPAADVYSLGATLFTLLTGRLPGQTGRTTAPPALLAVAAKAMADAPADRHPSAQELAADIDRWLADEPVSAHRDSALTRGRRWVRRHQTAAAAGLALLATATVGSGVGTGLVLREQRRTAAALDERTAALADARATFALAREAVDRSATRVAQERAFGRPGLEGLRAELLADARDFYDRLAARPSADPAAEAERALAYARLAGVTAATASAERAAGLCEQALSRLAPLIEDHPDRADLRRAERDLLARLAGVRGGQLRLDAARAAAGRALAAAEALAADHPDSLPDRAALADAVFEQAKLAPTGGLLAALVGAGPPADTHGRYERAARLYAELRAADPADPSYPRGEWRVLSVLASDAVIAGDATAAEARLRQCLSLAAGLAARGPLPPEDRFARAKEEKALAQLLLDRGPSAEGVAGLERAAAELEALVRDFPRELAYAAALADARHTQARRLAAAGDRSGAARVWEGLVAALGPAAAAHPDQLQLNLQVFRAAVSRAQHAVGSNPAEALAWCDRVAEIAARPAGRAVPAVFQVGAHGTRAEALAALGRAAEAVAEYDRAVAHALPHMRPGYQASRARQLVAAGRAADGVAAADAVAAGNPQGDVWVTLARVYSAAAAAPSTPPAEAERLANRAAAALAAAAKAGHLNDPTVARAVAAEPDLAPLRSQPGFPTPR